MVSCGVRPGTVNRTATLLVAILVVAASAVVAPVAAAQADTSTSTATSTARTANGTADGTGSDDVAAGAALSGVVGVQEAEIAGEMESRTFGIQVAKANTADAKAAVVAEQHDASEERLTTLRNRQESLEDARENGSITEDQYVARAATLRTEANNLRRMSNETATVSESLPRETLEANGVNVTAIRTLRRDAANVTGPAVAAAARTIAGPRAGQSPNRAGSADGRPDATGTASGDRADGTGTTPDDRTGRNGTDTTAGSGDGYDGDSDDARQSSESGR